MISVDTNLLARFLLKDDAAQFRRAVAALQSGEEVFIPVTVLLELAWVLKSMDTTREEVVASLHGILALPHVRAQHADAVRAALGWAEAGMEVADALHLALSSKSTRFLTFDTTLVRRASRMATQPPASLP